MLDIKPDDPRSDDDIIPASTEDRHPVAITWNAVAVPAFLAARKAIKTCLPRSAPRRAP
jgi:hypothetical protein